MLERMKTEESFNIYEYIQQLREERVFTVQSLVSTIIIAAGLIVKVSHCFSSSGPVHVHS